MIFIFLALSFFASSALASETDSIPKIVSLIPPYANEVLERENQIQSLCPQANQAENAACRKTKLQSKSWKLRAFSKPDFKSPLVGEISITATPGVGIKATLTDDKKKTFDYPSDSKETDWGYSSFFEFTVQAVAGDWIQLPKRPANSPFWIHPKIDWSIPPEKITPTPTALGPGSIYTSPVLGDLVILRFQKDSVIYRKENESDMTCGDDTPKKIPAEQLKEITKPIRDFYDKDGHLHVWLKYTRGC